MTERLIRAAGFAACLLGVLVMGAAASTDRLPHWMQWGGLAIVGVGWALFAISISLRVALARRPKD